MAQGRDTEAVGTRGGAPGPCPTSHGPFCLLLPHPREILGLVDVVTLENGELGPLLSAGTLRGLEDECVTDVKVLGHLGWGGDSGGHRGAWQAPLPRSLFPLPFPCGDLSSVQSLLT